jgi:hypothetical protein
VDRKKIITSKLNGTKEINPVNKKLSSFLYSEVDECEAIYSRCSNLLTITEHESDIFGKY